MGREPACTSLLALEWLNGLLEKNNLGATVPVRPMRWKRAVDGECHANSRDFCARSGRWEPVFGYAVDVDGDAQFTMHTHTAVRDARSGELRNLTKREKGLMLVVEDGVLAFDKHEQLTHADERLQELLTARFSDPLCIKGVLPMPFGQDNAAERDTKRVLLGASRQQDRSLREWTIAGCVLADGTAASVKFSVYYDNALRGLLVGIPRLVAAAALAKRDRELGAAGGSGEPR